MAAVYELVGQLTRKSEGKLFADNYFCSCALFDNISTRKINCCGTVCQSSKGMVHDFGHKLVQLVLWSVVFHEKLIIPQLVKKIPAFYDT